MPVHTGILPPLYCTASMCRLRQYLASDSIPSSFTSPRSTLKLGSSEGYFSFGGTTSRGTQNEQCFLFMFVSYPDQVSSSTSLHLAMSEEFRPPRKTLNPCVSSPYQYKESTTFIGSTPLHYAAANRHLSTVRERLRHGADVSALDKEGCAALHPCAKNQVNDEFILVQLLVEAGALSEVRDWRGLTPLQVAAERGNDQTVKLLLALGADVSSRSARS